MTEEALSWMCRAVGDCHFVPRKVFPLLHRSGLTSRTRSSNPIPNMTAITSEMVTFPKGHLFVKIRTLVYQTVSSLLPH